MYFNIAFYIFRAQKRMNKERVFNSQIVVSLPFAVKEESSSTSFISINCIRIGLKFVFIWNIYNHIGKPLLPTKEENIQHIATTIQYSSSNNMHSQFNMNPITPTTFENQTFG